MNQEIIRLDYNERDITAAVKNDEQIDNSLFPLVSVVVPVYNVEKYVEKCIKSIINQAYTNLQIIIVNDGSVDNSENIILELAKSDPRIQYISKTNGGLSSARNAGIEIAAGEYICFVDSDDWIDKEHIDLLVRANISNNTEISICNMRYIFADGSLRKRTPKITTNKIVSNIECFADLLESNGFRAHAVNKLYKTSLFLSTGIRYPEGKIYEDVYTTYKLIHEATKISYLNTTTYNYLQEREGSILATSFNDKRFENFKAMEEIHSFIINNKIDVKDSYSKCVINNTISIMNYIILSYDSIDIKKRKTYQKLIKDTYYRFDLRGYLSLTNLSVVEKARYWMLLHCYPLYVFLYKTLLWLRNIR